MFKTKSLREESLDEQFVPEEIYGIIWNWVKYDSTYKYDTTIGDARQALLDLHATRNDSESFKKTIQSFGVDLKDSGEDGVYAMEDPTTKDHHKLLRDLKSRLTRNPHRKTCMLWMLAGHGGVSEGQ